MKKLFIFLALLLTLLTTGCSKPEPTATSVPTLPANADATSPMSYPYPPTVFPTITSAYPAPDTEVPSIVTTAPEDVPTVAPPFIPTSENEPIPEQFLILSHGIGSNVTSPVWVSGEADSTFEQNLVIMITDAENSVLSLQPTTIQAELGERGPFSVEISFSIADDQPGRISVYESSAMNGALDHLNSVEVMLLASGSPTIDDPASMDEQIMISSPEMHVTVSGGTVEVSGVSAYFFEAQLNIVVCGSGGGGDFNLLCGSTDNIVGNGLAMIDSPDIGLPGTFSGTATYTVNEPQWGHIVVYAVSARDGGIIHAASVLVYLEP